MNLSKRIKMNLPHGASSRIAHGKKLTATQAYHIDGEYYTEIRRLRDERMEKEMKQIEKELAERKAAMDAAEIKASDLIKNT